ncbi:MAG: nucleotidyltransferase family protein [Solirubrobacteraceae bacterium]
MRNGGANVRVFGSVARGDAGPGSDVDILVDGGERFGLFDLAALQRELEDLRGCPVHVTTTGGLRQARAETRARIEKEAVPTVSLSETGRGGDRRPDNLLRPANRSGRARHEAPR